MISIVHVDLVGGPLGVNSDKQLSDEAIGSVIVFEGIVRCEEAGQHLESLRYEAYEPMTQNELHKLSQAIAEQFDLIAIFVEHSIGIVAVGETSFRLTLASSHRSEAIAACDAFIETMKEKIPLWKCPTFR